MKLNELTISHAIHGLREKQFSATELLSDCHDAITAKDRDLHAYLEVFDDAKNQAREADKIFTNTHADERAHLPLLLGIPFAIKDNILVFNKQCTAGSRMLEHYVASYDATIVKKLKNQGAVILGKTNLDEFAMGSSTEHSAFGPTKNPLDTTRVPGGSSGGSAAAVAANLCLGALGSDTGGSIRQPASFCGIVGMKPSYGAVSRHGLIAMASSLDQIGPLAKTVEDAKIIFQAIAGKDIFDSTSVELENQGVKVKNLDLKNIKIGIPKEYFGEGLDPRVKKNIRDALEKIERAGATLHEISLPHAEYALPAYYIIVPSEVSANLARYDSIRYGAYATANHQPSTVNLYDFYAQTRAHGFGAEVKRRIMLGTYALSAGYYDAYYLKAQKVRRLIAKDFEDAFQKVDIIIGPTTPTAAFRFGERSHDPLSMYYADLYTVAVNLAGLPALSMPAGIVAGATPSLPAGLQLIGPRAKDYFLLKIGALIESLNL